MQRNAYRVAVLTASDRCHRGEQTDQSGPLAVHLVKEAGFVPADYVLLPDERQLVEKQLLHWCESDAVELILTTGGTGFGPRDLTPEATLAVGERLAQGIAEALRAHSMAITPLAMLSRGVAVIRGRTLIVNLPGSPKAVEESLAFLLPHLPHALAMLAGEGHG